MDINLVQSRGILLDMLERRGYDVSNYKNYSINEIRIMRENKTLDMRLEKESGSKCYVKYNIYKKLKSNELTKIVKNNFINEDAELTPNDELIIICNDNNILISKKYSNFMSKLENFYYKNYFVQIFNVDSLLFDVTKHNLVPEHIILSDDEKQDILKQYNISENKLPRISRFDPVAKFIGIKPNQVCKIIRNSYTCGESVYYRICY